MNEDYYCINNCLPKELAEEVYSLLVVKLNAQEKYREDCVISLVNPSNFSKEFRLFGSVLGWGSKIHWDGWELTVSYYSEDFTEERLQLKKEVNKELIQLLKKYNLLYD